MNDAFSKMSSSYRVLRWGKCAWIEDAGVIWPLMTENGVHPLCEILGIDPTRVPETEVLHATSSGVQKLVQNVREENNTSAICYGDGVR